jgi:small redox-active disulfide protein 2
MKILVLGSGCAKCKALEGRVRNLVAEHHVTADVEKVTDLQEIMKYGIMSTPGLVVEGKLKSAGIVPKDDQILEWLRNAEQ